MGSPGPKRMNAVRPTCLCMLKIWQGGAVLDVFLLCKPRWLKKETVTNMPLIFQNSKRVTNHDSSFSRPSSWAFAWFWNIAIAVAMRLKPSFL